MFERNARATAIAVTTAAFCLNPTGAWASADSSRIDSVSAETSAKAAEERVLSYQELEAQIAAYRQYHAEEELLNCLRDAKSDPEIRGTHKVGPRLKQLEVQQRRYADFRSGDSALGPEDRQRVERKIVELHLQQKKHIEFVRGLFANGRATTDDALLEYHDTGCIDGLESIVKDIRASREATQHPETSAGGSP